MNKYIYLLKNIGLLTLSNFATKLLSFFLVPLYTNILTTAEYGTYDLFNTTVSVLLPILTLNIQESVLRFTIDNKKDNESILGIGLKYFFISTCIVVCLLIINNIFGFISIAKEYWIFFLLMFVSQALSGIIIAYVRGIDHVSYLALSSVLASTVSIALNILFLVYFKWGLHGYFLASIIGPMTQTFYLFIKCKLYLNCRVRFEKTDQEKGMLLYSKPLIANSISWWINSSSDRYIIILFCGVAANGIYSVASKIPSILNILQTVFNQAWTLSAVKDYDKNDSTGFFSTTYKLYNCLMVVTCSAIILVDKVLAKILYAKDFYAAWQYVPWLTIAIVFGAMSGYLGGFFSAVKNSKIYAQSTIAGALINFVLNIIFTSLIGPLGAAIATTISYCVVWVIRYHHSKRYINMSVNIHRDIISYFLLVLQGMILLVSNGVLLYIIEGGLFITIVCLYFRDISGLINKLLKK